MIIGGADDHQNIQIMSDYIVNTVWGLLTGFAFVSQTAVRTVNFDDIRTSHSSEDTNLPDDRSRVTPDAAEHANADTADVLDSIYVISTKTVKVFQTIVSDFYKELKVKSFAFS